MKSGNIFLFIFKIIIEKMIEWDFFYYGTIVFGVHLLLLLLLSLSNKN